MKKSFNLMLLSGVIFLMIILGINALLIDTVESESITLTSGKISYTVGGNLKSGLVVPGENLIDSPIALINNSTVSHTLRISIEIRLDENIIDLNGSDGYIIDEDLTDSFVLESDGYYHYQEMDYEISSSVTSINVLTNIVLNGYQVQNNFSGKQFKIFIKLYVRQYDNISWDDLGSINFETGLPN